MTTAAAKRLNTGLYEVSYKGRVFQVEDIARASDGDCLPGWMLYEMEGDKRSYWNDFGTKRAAVAAIVSGVDAGF